LEEYLLRRKDLAQAIEKELDLSIEWLKTIPDVRTKMEGLFELCGKGV
jgi:hypothetical protein